MAVTLRPVAPLEPVLWPTGEEVAVKRPNLFAAKVWDEECAAKPEQLREGLVRFVAMVCPSKTEDQIREECDEEFLWLVANYARERLDQARAFLEQAVGKVPGATAPASPPPTDTGTSPDASPAPAGAPCGS